MEANPRLVLPRILQVLRSPEEAHRELRSNAVLVAAGVIAAGLGYVWTLIAGRMLSVAEYADFAAATALLYFANGTLAPVAQTVAYFTARNGASGSVARSTERPVALISVAGLIAAAVAARPLARVLHLRSDLAPVVLAATVALLAILAVRRGHVQGIPRFDTYASNTLIEAIVRLAALGVIGVLVHRAWAALGTYAIGAALALTLLPLAASEGRDRLAPMVRYFVPTFLAMAVYSAFLNTDVVLVKLYFAPAAAALYGAASFLGRAAGMIVMPFYVYAVPRLVAVRDDRAELLKRFRQIAVRYVALSLAGVLVLAIAKRFAISILIGSGYRAASDLIVPMAIAVALGGFNFIICQLPSSLERFGFLPLYLVGYAAEIAAIVLLHRTMYEVILLVIAAHAVTLVVLVAYIAAAFRSRAAAEVRQV